MKTTLAFLLVLSLVGCGYVDRAGTEMTGRPAKICVEGVSYLQFTSGATVQLDVSGKPVACKG